MSQAAKSKAIPAEPDFHSHVYRAAQIASDHKALDIVAYDVRGLTLIADGFLLCSARSEPQIRAIAEAMREGMKDSGLRLLAVEGDTHSGWVVMDYGNLIFHIFRPQSRSFYDLDGLWGDAPRIELPVDE